MKNLFNIITVISALLTILCVMIQSRGQSLGASFGGDSSFYRGKKRGSEAVVYNATIVFAVIFVLSVILSILSKK